MEIEDIVGPIRMWAQEEQAQTGNVTGMLFSFILFLIN